ncbi:CoA transferase, partial [Burkholderia pseudomallei]|uniref:CoA transferase n=1 Tax=Burkholderia pseudomallei TaxID=28450 RepID=UPI000AB252D1
PPSRWPRLRERLAEIFASRPRAHWVELMEGTDACFAPVLSPAEAQSHPHLAARGVYAQRDGILQAAPAPRFSGSPNAQPGAVPKRGADSAAILREAGFAEDEIAALAAKE